MARGPMKARVVCGNGSPPSLGRSTRELWSAPFACIPERRVACHPKLSSCVEQPTVARTDLLASYGGHPSRAYQSEGWPATRSSRVASNSPPSLAPIYSRAMVGTLRVHTRAKGGAGNGIRTRDFDLGKVALYH